VFSGKAIIMTESLLILRETEMLLLANHEVQLASTARLLIEVEERALRDKAAAWQIADRRRVVAGCGLLALMSAGA
jgi:hypothetical protein